ncbi:MAG: N-acetylmuramoyl-L-alanine amidase [Clostridia bacterium]
MHKLINAKNIDFAAIFAVILTIAVIALAFSTPLVYADYHNKIDNTIVIDAGHGGIDGGVVGVKTGVKESVLNLKIAKIVGEYLMSAGFNVIFTRTNEGGLYADNVLTTKKRDDMEKRKKIIDRANAKAVISVHMNSYSSQSRRGAQVFFNRKNKDSKIFGDIMQNLLNKDLNVAVGREYLALSAEKFILECTPSPVIIVECGFLSNPLDEANLINPTYQIKLAYSIAQGAVFYLSSCNSLT